MKVISTKTYTIIESKYEDGTESFVRLCEGFSVTEILGHIWLVQKEIDAALTKGISIPLIIEDKEKKIGHTKERKIKREGKQ